MDKKTISVAERSLLVCLLLGLYACAPQYTASHPDNTNPAPFTQKEALVPGIGLVRVGAQIEHRKLGKGTIELLDSNGRIVRAVILFQDGEKRPMVLSPEYFYAVQ